MWLRGIKYTFSDDIVVARLGDLSDLESFVVQVSDHIKPGS